MGSKVIVFLGLFVATILLCSSEVAARELVETSDTVEPPMEIDLHRRGYFGRYGGYPGYGGGYGGYPGYGGGYGGYPGYGGGYGGYPRGGYGRHCRYGCCGGEYYGACRCCIYPGENFNAEPQTKPQN